MVCLIKNINRHRFLKSFFIKLKKFIQKFFISHQVSVCMSVFS